MPSKQSAFHVPCNDKTRQAVVILVRQGIPPIVAANARGVPPEIFEEWMERGSDSNKAGNWRYVKFRREVEQAEAVAEANLIESVREMAEHGNYQAAAWLAERRWPERYVRKSVNAPDLGRPPKTEDPARPTDPFEDLDDKPNVTPIRRGKG